MRINGRRWATLLAVAIAAVAAEPTQAGDAQAITIDIQTLLSSDHVLKNPYLCTVYRPAPAERRQLVMIPFRVNAVSEAIEVSSSELTLATGRFLAWWIPHDPQLSGPQKRGIVHTGRLGETVTLDEAPPRLARDIKLTPDGRVHWSLSTTMPSATVLPSANVYTLRLDRGLMLPPATPVIPPRRESETPADYNRRRNQALADNQRVRAEYALKQKAVNELPTQFSEPAPRVIWAVFEASQLLRELKLSGPEPLPWSIDFELFQTLQRLTRPGARNGSELAAPFPKLLADNHPLSRAAAAIVLAAGANINLVTEDSPLAQTLESLITTGDPQSRRLLVEASARHVATAPLASAMLLKAAADADPAVTLLAMRTRVVTAGPELDESLAAKIADSATRVLAMTDDAPDPQVVLDLAVDLAKKQPAAIPLLAERVALAQTAPARRDMMLRHVLDLAAARNPLGERWLDRQLLGASDASLRNRTLALIIDPAAPQGAAAESPDADADAAEPKKPGGPFGGLLGGVRPGQAADPAPPAAAPAATASTAEPLNPRVFALSHTDHSLLKLLVSPDADLRAKAWSAAQQFRISAPEGAAATDVSPIYAAVVGAALSAERTPMAALRFVVLQADAPLKQAQMERVLLEGKGESRAAALRWLAAMPAGAFVGLYAGYDGERRIELARLWYASGPASDAAMAEAMGPVLGLLHQQGEDAAPGEVVKWFAERIIAGERPHPRAWSGVMKTEDAMVDMLLGDNAILRRAGAAGLLALVTWPTDTLIDQLLKVAKESALGAGEADLVKPKFVGTWGEIKAKLIAETTQSVAGAYRVSMLVVPRGRPEAATIESAPPGVVVPLGETTATLDAADPGKVRFTPESLVGTLASNPVMIKLEDAAALGALLPEDAERPAIDWPSQPLDLVPGPGGGWIGDMSLPDGRRLRVRFDRRR